MHQARKLPDISITAGDPFAAPGGGAMLEGLLLMLEHELDARRVPWRENLNPGLESNEIGEQLAAVGLSCPEELEVLYRWRNGAVSDQSHVVLPGFHLAPLQLSINNSKEFWRVSQEFEGWASLGSMYGAGLGWLTITVGSWGYAIECNEQPGIPPRVRLTGHDFLGPLAVAQRSQARSLCTLVTLWIETITSGGTSWNDETQTWVDDLSRWPALRLEHRL